MGSFQGAHPGAVGAELTAATRCVVFPPRQTRAAIPIGTLEFEASKRRAGNAARPAIRSCAGDVAWVADARAEELPRP